MRAMLTFIQIQSRDSRSYINPDFIAQGLIDLYYIHTINSYPFGIRKIQLDFYTFPIMKSSFLPIV